MVRPTYPPSPPQTPTFTSYSSASPEVAGSSESTSPFRRWHHQAHSVVTTTGNPLLCLPRSIRDRIYRLSLAATPSWQYTEVPDIGSISLPTLRYVDRLFWNEITALVLQEATWSVASAPAAYNLLVIIESLGLNHTGVNGGGVRTLGSLELVGLSMWEKSSVFRSDAARLLSRCVGVRMVKILVDLRDIPFTRRDGYPMVSIHTLFTRHDLEMLVGAKGLEEVRIGFWPFMRLERMIGGLEGERIWAGRLRREMGDLTPVPGAERFWGVCDWMEEQSRKLGVALKVRVEFRQRSQ